MADKEFNPVDNLIPVTQRPEDEVRAMRLKGGQKSGETRRRKKNIREICETLLSMPATPEMLATIKRSVGDAESATGDKLNVYEAIVLAQTIKATRGDTAAAQYIRDSAGDKPTDKQEVDLSAGMTIKVDLTDD